MITDESPEVLALWHGEKSTWKNDEGKTFELVLQDALRNKQPGQSRRQLIAEIDPDQFKEPR